MLAVRSFPAIGTAGSNDFNCRHPHAGNVASKARFNLMWANLPTSGDGKSNPSDGTAHKRAGKPLPACMPRFPFGLVCKALRRPLAMLPASYRTHRARAGPATAVLTRRPACVIRCVNLGNPQQCHVGH